MRHIRRSPRREGGITGTIKQVRSASKKELKRSTARYLGEMMKHGTTAVEIKTGYGLDMDSEVKMLEAINELASEEMATVVPTFLGAHAVPPEYRADAGEYVRLVIDRMIPYAGKKKLALFCDVFCEAGYFDVAQSEAILTAGKQWGMMPKIHAEELSPLGGRRVGREAGCGFGGPSRACHRSGDSRAFRGGCGGAPVAGRFLLPEPRLRSCARA